MKVTDIKAQIKNKDRFSIFVDGRYTFSLSAWQIGELKIKVGQNVDQELVSQFQEQSDFGKLYDRTLRWAYMRLRSEREIDMYVKKLSDDSGTWEQIKERLDRLGLIDDREFARAWVASRRRSKHSSDIKLRSELRQKGVDESVISKELSNSEIDENDALRQLIEKKRKITRYQDDKKLMQYLAGQGYRYDQIKCALGQQHSE